MSYHRSYKRMQRSSCHFEQLSPASSQEPCEVWHSQYCVTHLLDIPKRPSCQLVPTQTRTTWSDLDAANDTAPYAKTGRETIWLRTLRPPLSMALIKAGKTIKPSACFDLGLLLLSPRLKSVEGRSKRGDQSNSYVAGCNMKDSNVGSFRHNSFWLIQSRFLAHLCIRQW